jgi:hypothetical protein|tara:strand:+ start:67 stop:606 length:540 start_codon:yes stop_codon:yes gene_type:complete
MHLDFMRDKSKVMPQIESPLEVTSIRIWHCKYESLEQINKCKNIEVLVIASLPAEDFEFLKNFKNLKYLSVVHLPKINDLSPLEAITSLETVSLSTLPSWDSSGKVSVISTLVPLASLPKLKHLELFGVRPENKSPLELTSSKSLVSIRLSKYAKKLEKELYESTGITNDWAPEPEFRN